jgi:D-arabinose 1-dehydrogenase-like Zn-dependent alcohol dehydrogenase
VAADRLSGDRILRAGVAQGDPSSRARMRTTPVAAGTAYDTLENLRLEPGSTLLVNGAGGGVGVCGCQKRRTRHATC